MSHTVLSRARKFLDVDERTRAVGPTMMSEIFRCEYDRPPTRLFESSASPPGSRRGAEAELPAPVSERVDGLLAQLDRALARSPLAWGVLGVSRLPYALATGEIISKEAAGEYALQTFAAEWGAIIEDALAFRREDRAVEAYRRHPMHRARAAAGFVEHVIDSAQSGDP